MEINAEVIERIYAGVLGKIIGVYIGRPFEGWSNDKIEQELGEIRGYVNERVGQPLVVTDDDISGTFTFFRALEDHGYSPSLESRQIGETWRNYIIENRTILWWGGMGMSTEHTAFLRLKEGIDAPASGSIALNGATVAEQIGAQIFIEGWGLAFPGEPTKAADFAGRAGSVSHDGESVLAAQVIAAMVAQAFTVPVTAHGAEAVATILSTALEIAPEHTTIGQVIRDVQRWHGEGIDWRTGFARVKAKYGYDKFGGACHVVPNHALVILALYFGAGNFDESQMIVNTCGWDTDCNAANVGSILGVLRGLAAFEGRTDWRGPVRDRLFLPTADGGRCVTDAVREADAIVRAAFRLRGESPPAPKGGARFHFSYPGSVQGFGQGVHDRGRLAVEAGRTTTPTFPSATERKMGGYALYASPTLTSGQTLRAHVEGGTYRLCIGVDGQYLESEPLEGIGSWQVPDTGGKPILEVGIVASTDSELDWLTWDGSPNTTYAKAGDEWVNGVDQLGGWPHSFSVVHNRGTGLVSTGTREWGDLEVRADVTLALCERGGLAVRVQGMRRYLALLACRDQKLRLIRVLGGESLLAERDLEWNFDVTLPFRIRLRGDQIEAEVGGVRIEATDDAFTGGGIALVVTEGRIGTDSITVGP